MKILELQTAGFRSLKEITWKPGDLNVLIGPNGAGKSNLLRLLEMISISAKGQLGKHIQSLGGMEPIVWDGSAEEIRWSIKGSVSEVWRDLAIDELTYEIVLARLGRSSAYRVENESLGDYYPFGRLNLNPSTLLSRRGLQATMSDDQGNDVEVDEGSLSEEETLLALLGGPHSYNRLIPPYHKELAGWSVYHDLHVNQEALIRQPTVTRLEKRVDPDGQNLVSVLHTLYTGDRDFRNEINLAMRAAFGDDFEELVFPPAADQRIQLRLKWKSLKQEQSAAELSDGTLRFLLMLAVLASPDAAPVIAIDEPETGLHPSMFPIVAEHAVEASTRSQVILTTHSPQFLDAFGDTTPTTTVAMWEGGQTVLKTLEGDVLREWLKGYSLGKLFQSGELEDLP